jgi:predicted transcriptional regulator
MSDKELAKWCEALSTQFAEETVPSGWKTSKEIAELLNRSSSRVSEMLATAIRKGTCERKLFRVHNGGTVRPVPHYKLK